MSCHAVTLRHIINLDNSTCRGIDGGNFYVAFCGLSRAFQLKCKHLRSCRDKEMRQREKKKKIGMIVMEVSNEVSGCWNLRVLFLDFLQSGWNIIPFPSFIVFAGKPVTHSYSWAFPFQKIIHINTIRLCQSVFCPLQEEVRDTVFSFLSDDCDATLKIYTARKTSEETLKEEVCVLTAYVSWEEGRRHANKYQHECMHTVQTHRQHTAQTTRTVGGCILSVGGLRWSDSPA